MEQLRRTWQILRADRYVRVSARQEALLRGIVRPQRLDVEERRALIDVFGISFLNAVAFDSAADLSGALEILSSLPLPLATRGIIWAASLSSVSQQDLRRELYDAAAG